jgi:hypothetical protein
MADTTAQGEPSTPSGDSPFTRAEAKVCGLTDQVLRGSGFRRVFWGVHVGASTALSLEVRARAALAIAPAGALLTHHTAGLLWDAVVPHSPDLHVGMPRRDRMQVTGIAAHRYISMPEARHRRGLRVTSPERTFLDLAGLLTLVDLVVAGDSLVRKGHTTPQALRAVAAEFRGRGARRARQAAALVRAQVDSPMETRVRLLIVLAGLPEPVVNLAICEADGRVVYRIDLAFADVKVAVEYDGRHHVERQEQWGRDLLRREELEADGWRFVVITAADVYKTPEQTLARIVATLRERGLRARIRLDTWRLHFPTQTD